LKYFPGPTHWSRGHRKVVAPRGHDSRHMGEAMAEVGAGARIGRRRSPRPHRRRCAKAAAAAAAAAAAGMTEVALTATTQICSTTLTCSLTASTGWATTTKTTR
jgi:hypothetical protein